MKALDIS